MTGLTTTLLSNACRHFLALAYAGNPKAMLPKKRIYWDISADCPLASLLPPAAPPDVCQILKDEQGKFRGYAFRLGSLRFPHLKLQVTACDHGQACVFSVDTHDALNLPADHPEAAMWCQLKAANRQLKEQIEKTWDEHQILTFNELLRRGLRKQ